MNYIYTTGKLTLNYFISKDGDGYCHTFLVEWKDKTTGMMKLYNKKKKPDIYQFSESIELVDTRFFKTYKWLDEWGEVISEFDEVIKSDNTKTLKGKKLGV